MAENRAQEHRAPKKKKKLTFGRVIGGIFKFLGTLLVIGVLTAALFFQIFMKYVHTNLEPEMDVDASAYTLKLSSMIYAQDKTTGEWYELRKLYDEENRTIVDYDQIPDHVVKALVSIEDERFYEHNGVDWKRTLGAVYKMFTGQDVQGGSTITQQVIKNLTGENQVTIRRKVLEIFRAMRFRENYTDEEILEIYFNKVYFGHHAYGIQAAAQTYFGKDVGDLTVEEGAAIVGITQNPWKFDPLRSDWSREQNEWKKNLVLSKMHELGYLNDVQYERAKNTKLVFVGDQDYVEQTEDPEVDGEGTEPTDAVSGLATFFEEQVFNDVVAAFMKQGYSKETARDMLYNGGYRIYCTMDSELQEIIEEVYADRSNLPYQAESGNHVGEYLQSGMTIIDNSTGNIVAIAGRVGERNGAFEFNYAASTSPCGSAIKPLSVYAPALDAGVITPASVIDDYPLELNGEKWPVNAYRGYNGLVTLQKALRVSSNPCAVRTLAKLTNTASYTFMTENLGFTSLDPNEDLYASGALALGGLHYGVSTIEMAAAYSTFASNGVYTRPRTFTQVLDSNGNVVIDNKPESWVAMKETTVFAINELLKGVIRSSDGTGTMAAFNGMTIAGKTGTTNNRRDRYFVGYTPYYTAACWVGYPHPAQITAGGNPAASMWKLVMERVHEGLENKDFPTDASGMTSVTVCTRTGLRAGPNCTSHTVLVAAGSAPTLVCDGCVEVQVCTESGLLARDFCPEETLETRVVVDLTAENVAKGFGYTRESFLTPLSVEQRAIFDQQFADGLIDEIPAGTPLHVNDSDYVLSDLILLGVCTVHTEPQPIEIDLDDPETWPEGFDPKDPETWPEGWEPPEPTEPDPNDPGEVTDPTNPTVPTDPTEPTDPTVPDTPPEPGGDTPPEPGGDTPDEPPAPDPNQPTEQTGEGGEPSTGETEGESGDDTSAFLEWLHDAQGGDGDGETQNP